MEHIRTWVFLLATVATFTGCRKEAEPVLRSPGNEARSPLEFRFNQSSGLPEGRQQVYDEKTGVFHVHFQSPTPIGSSGSGLYERSAFEVAKINGPFVKPVVFRLTGVPQNYGCVGDPLCLCVGIINKDDDLRLDGKCYALVNAPLAPGLVDRSLFRVESKDDVVTVEFTEKGQSLLTPGALISFKVDTGW